MAREPTGGPVADFCAGLKKLQQTSGLGVAALARRLRYGRAQLHEILEGRIKSPPDWTRLVEPLVRACTGNDEGEVAFWRRRHGELVELHGELKGSRRRGDSSRPPDRTRAVPAQLPANADVFTGRAKELGELDHLLSATGGAPTAVRIFVISGTPGVGKTALALRWAHRVRDGFPDGQLYVDLRGYDPRPPVSPEQALDGFLRALDVAADEIPTGLDAQAALYRSLLDGQRVLVMLDNARDAKQLRPLLPGSPGCLVLVTSRNRLAGLVARDGAHRVDLDALPPPEAVVLLRQIIGAARVDAERDVADRLVRQCVYLPLALRIAAERVVSHPHITLVDLTRELGNERDRLDVLAADDDEDTAVRGVFFWSYRALPAEAARMFRLLGLHTGPDISVSAAAALAGITIARARRLLDVLNGGHLLEATGRDRHRFHDLLRVYAAERADDEETDADREVAVRRLFDWYLHTADAAGRVLTPQWRQVPLESLEASYLPLAFTTYQEALEWCETERANLVAVVDHAADSGQHVVAWKLAAVLWNFFYLREHWTDWITTHETGLAAAQYLHDRHGEAWIANNLGEAYRGLGRFDEALGHLHKALALWREINDRWGEGWTLFHLGNVYRDLGRFDEALDHYQQALARGREMRKWYGVAWALHTLGTTYRALGRFDEALDNYREALDVRRKMGTDRWGEAWTLLRLGTTCRALERLDEALDHYKEALNVYREIGDRWGEGRTLHRLGEVLHDTGRLETARASWRQALDIFEELLDSHADDVRARLETLNAEDPGHKP